MALAMSCTRGMDHVTKVDDAGDVAVPSSSVVGMDVAMNDLWAERAKLADVTSGRSRWPRHG